MGKLIKTDKTRLVSFDQKLPAPALRAHVESLGFGSANLAMSTRVLEALPGKLNIKRHSPSILFIMHNDSLKDDFFRM